MKKKGIKIPKIRQLPSGNWTCQLRIGGQDISITDADYNTVYAQAIAIKGGLVKVSKTDDITLSEAIEQYINTRANILSPSTIRGYKTIQKYRFRNAMNKSVSSMNKNDWQKLCNDEILLCSAKTLKNAWHFISSVIFETIGERYTVRLPQVIIREPVFLEPEQIPVFITAMRNTDMEIPVLLGLSSMRWSEIANLKWQNVDFENKFVYVRGSAVRDENNNLIYKETNKNNASRRNIPMIPQLYNALSACKNRNEYVLQFQPKKVYSAINKICIANNLPKVGIHGLRHSFASLAYHLGLPEKIAMEIGGWSDNHVMHKIYTHIAKNDRLKSDNLISEYFQKIENANAIANN